MRRALTMMLGLLPLLAPAGAQAQTIPSPFRYIEATQSVGLFGGYLWTDGDELGTRPQSAPLLGLRYSARFAGPLSGEIAVSGIPSRRTVVRRATLVQDSAVAVEPEGEVDAPLVMALAGLRFQVTGPRTWRGLAPFVSASGGVVADLAGGNALEETIPEDERVDFGPAFAVGVGLGTDWFLSERLSVRLAAHDYIWRLTTPAGLTFENRERTEWTNNLGLTLGAALHF